MAKSRKRSKKKEIEETLPYTEGDGSVYRKDEKGNINIEKVVNGAVTAVKNFKIAKPEIDGVDFKKFAKTLKNLNITEEEFRERYAEKDIEGVNTGGIVGDIANEIIRNKYSDTNK